MPIVMSELFDSAFVQSGDTNSVENRYEVKGDSDRLAIRDHVLANVPATYDGLPLRQVGLAPFGRTDHWKATVRYGVSQTGGGGVPSETGDIVRTFDTGGGTQHIDQARATPQEYAPVGSTAPAQNNAINATKDGVNGVDITVPAFNFTLTKYIPDATFNVAYRKGIASLTGRVNVATFEGFNAKEVLFLGASGSYRPDYDDWEVTFNFSQSDNRDDIAIGTITGIEKKGWEYLWVLYEDAVDQNSLVKQVKGVYVNEVYETGDFTPLGA